MLKFSIPAWHAWAPGIENAEAWRKWAHKPYIPRADTTTRNPQLGHIPPMERRRLSPLARMAVGCAWPLVQDGESAPMVYASHHGETTRGFQLLQTLARDEPLSPTSFSLSVHNACAGMWSILRHDTAESVALSAQGDGLENAIVEACLLLQGGHPAVLVVLAEEQAPAAYQPWVDDIPFPYAMALRLTPGHSCELELGAPSEPRAPSEPGAPPDAALDLAHMLPHPLSLLRHLALGTHAWTHTHQRRDWRWRQLS